MSSVLKLQYTNETHTRTVLKILTEKEISVDTRVVFKPEPKLKEILSRTALLPTPCNRKNYYFHSVAVLYFVLCFVYFLRCRDDLFAAIDLLNICFCNLFIVIIFTGYHVM